MKKFPTFEELGEDTYGWETCFDTNQRYRHLYIYDTRVAEVYENGRVVFTTTFKRNPIVRRRVSSRLNLDVRLLSEVVGCEFYTTDGRKIHRSDIDTNDTPVLLDHDFGILKSFGYYSYQGGNMPLTYVHPNAQPSGGGKFRIGVVNKGKVNKAMKLIEPYAMLGSTVVAMSDSGGNTLSAGGAAKFIATLLAGNGPTLEDAPVPILKYFGKAQLKGTLRSAVYAACKEFSEVDTLLFKRK